MPSSMEADLIASELILLGAAMASGETALMIRNRFTPELLEHTSCRVGMEAVATRDRELMVKFLGTIGVHLRDEEKAIDGVARTILYQAIERQSRQLAQTESLLEKYEAA